MKKSNKSGKPTTTASKEKVKRPYKRREENKKPFPWEQDSIKGIHHTADDILRQAAAGLVDLANKLDKDQYTMATTWNKQSTPMMLAEDISNVFAVATKIRKLAMNVVDQHIKHSPGSSSEHATMQALDEQMED